MKYAADEAAPKSSVRGINIFIGFALIAWFTYAFLNDNILFHFSSEAFSSIICFCVFLIALNTRSFTEESYLTLLGVVFVFIGISGIIHALSIDGMTKLWGLSRNISLQIRVVQRIIECISFLLSAIFINRKLKLKFVTSFYFVLMTGLLLSIFYWSIFPTCATSDSKGTLFYFVSGWITAGIILASLLILIRNKPKLDNKVFNFMAAVFFALFVSEILLSIGADYKYTNMAGHFLKVVSFYFIYKSIVESSLRTPYRLMFYELSNMNDTLKEKASELEKEIVGHNKTEEELNHTREFNLAMAEGFPGMIWTQGADMRCNYVNQEIVEYTGMSRTQLLDNGWINDIHPEDMDMCLKTASGAYDSHLPFYLEARLLRYDGEYCWHSITGTPVNGSEGIFIGYIGVCYDITERKQKEEALERYQLLLDKANDIIFFIDLEGNILEANKAAEKIYGYTYSEMLTKNIYNLRSPWEEALAQLQLQKAASSGVLLETAHYRKDGSCFDVEVSAQSTVVGGKTVIISIIRDISDRRKAQALLRESEFKYHSLFENINEALVYGQMVTRGGSEADYKILEVNKALERITGFKAESLIGRNAAEILSHMQIIYNKVIFDENGERYEIKADWLKKWFAISTYRVGNGYFVAIISDITEQKLLQERLENSNKGLQIILEELKSTQAHLIQHERLAGIGQLAAGVAHEINNPLAFVISNHETLNKYLTKIKDLLSKYRDLENRLIDIEDEDIRLAAADIESMEDKIQIDFIMEDLKGLIDDTNSGLERIHNIVKGLRIFSRVDQRDRFEQYDLNAGIQNTLIVANNEIKYDARVELSLGDIPVIYGDGGQINQVLLNVIINAVQAIKSREPGELGTIKIITSSDRKSVCCEIEDNGIGIPKKDKEKVLDPFYTTKPVGQGTGLGLSISYDIIVNKHGGELLIESKEGEGTKVIIKLPLEKERVS